MKKGSTRVTRVIRARRKDVYESFLDAKAVARWLPPASMAGVVHRFAPREGARFRISLTYQGAEHLPGKTPEDTDTMEGRFAKLVPYEKIVEVVEFESEDATFAGEMRLIASFVDAVGGTEVTMVCEDIPSGIRPEDNLRVPRPFCAFCRKDGLFRTLPHALPFGGSFKQRRQLMQRLFAPLLIVGTTGLVRCG